jgi:hypothetical protein
MGEKNRIMLAVGIWLVLSVLVFCLAHFIYKV